MSGTTTRGGPADDDFFIGPDDVIVENPGGGIDTIHTWGSSYVLPENVENLVLTGNSWSSGTGNGLGNIITGNVEPNHLDGGAGNDTLIGGGSAHEAGHVIPRGDTFIIRAGEGIDTIRDFAPGADEGDVIQLEGQGFQSFAAVMATARQEGADVVFQLRPDQALTVQNTTLGQFVSQDFDYTATITGIATRANGTGGTVAVLTGKAAENSALYVTDPTIADPTRAGLDKVALVHADAQGNWTYTTEPLSEGQHSFAVASLESKFADDQTFHYFEFSTSAAQTVTVAGTASPPPFDHTVTGGAGNDVFADTPGRDLYDGGAGQDSVSFTLGFRSGTFAREADGDVTFTHGGEVDTLRGVEVANFADGRLVFDDTDPVTQVARLYKAALGRDADQAGLNAWSGGIAHGASLASVAQGFVGSTEFAALYGTDLTTSDYVEALYNHALGRASDTEGKAAWTAALDTGAITRADALVNFSESAEAHTHMAGLMQAGIWDLSENAASVARLYDTTLGRQPDVEGLQAWRTQLDSGTMTLADEAKAFMGSAEFAAHYGSATSNADFVELLYNNALDRASDAAGKAGWTAALDAGSISRADAVLLFSESAEHQALAAPNIASEDPGHFGILFA
ncbi:DUF4214 domain-containing protein [Roseomonas sp. GCM10028921]